MHRGFIINNISFDPDPYYEIGKERFELQKTTVQKNLDAFMAGDNILDATKMRDNWFPQVNAHAFISHSHRDANNAIAFAGWLYHHFKIDAFIDSGVWGYCEELQQIIDNEYSRDRSGGFDYRKRNATAAHIHMMLSTALAMMIDKAECLFFMDTPNSVMPAKDIQKTLSPWIYFEIATTQTIQKKAPVRVSVLESAENEREYLERSLNMAYTLDLNHLQELEKTDLDYWSSGQQLKNAENALDKLYAFKPAKEYPDALFS